MSELIDKLRAMNLNEDTFSIQLKQEAADRIDELENPWISVDDRLPEEYETVLLGHWAKTQEEPNGIFLWIASGEYVEGEWFCDFTDDSFIPSHFHTVTHWSPKPPPPQEQSK